MEFADWFMLVLISVFFHGVIGTMSVVRGKLFWIILFFIMCYVDAQLVQHLFKLAENS